MRPSVRDAWGIAVEVQDEPPFIAGRYYLRKFENEQALVFETREEARRAIRDSGGSTVRKGWRHVLKPVRVTIEVRSR